MRIRATPRLAQPFITSPARRTPSSDGRSPNGSSPSPTIRKTAIVASTQNAAMSCTLCKERKRTHGGRAPPCPDLWRCVGTSSSSLYPCCVIASGSKPAPRNPPRLPIGYGGSIGPSKRPRVLLYALDVDGPHDLPLRAHHHRYDDFRSGAAEVGEIPRVFGHVAHDDGLPGGDRGAAQASGDRETGINGRSGTVEGDVGDLVFHHLIDAHPTIAAGAPDRHRDASSLLFAAVISLQNARDLSEQVRLVHSTNNSS